MLPENNQYVYELAMEIMDGAEVSIPQVTGHSERIVEVPTAAKWLKEFSKTENCKILDIGFTMSSLDWLGLLLRLKNKEKCIINAIDIVKPARVKSRYPEAWLEDIFDVPIEIGDIRTEKIPENEFDVVTCISTIEHIGFDEAEEEDNSTAFKRYKDEAHVRANRSSTVNKDVLAQFHKALKPGGHAIITTPMGKGGPTLLKDSLGLYTRQWEYETDSWQDLVSQPGFEIVQESFYGLNDNGYWQQQDSSSDLREKSSELQPHAHGCAFVVFRKI